MMRMPLVAHRERRARHCSKNANCRKRPISSSSRNSSRSRFSSSDSRRASSLRPAVPALSVKTAAQSIEKHEIFKPPGVVAAKSVIGGAIAGAGTEQEFARGARQQRQLCLLHALKVNPVPGIGKLRDSLPRNQSTFSETVETNQQNIPGKGRSGRVGRVAYPRGIRAAEPAKATDGQRPGNR